MLTLTGFNTNYDDLQLSGTNQHNNFLQPLASDNVLRADNQQQQQSSLTSLSSSSSVSHLSSSSGPSPGDYKVSFFPSLFTSSSNASQFQQVCSICVRLVQVLTICSLVHNFKRSFLVFFKLLFD